jgi:hypothetical protein
MRLKLFLEVIAIHVFLSIGNLTFAVCRFIDDTKSMNPTMGFLEGCCSQEQST